MQREITVTWHGHACFSLVNSRYTLVLDPYKPDMIGYPPLEVEAHFMLASHQHQDHNYRPSVRFLTADEASLQPVDCRQPWPQDADPDLFYYKAIASKHDDAGGEKRGDNWIHVIYTAGMTIVHLGDLGHLLSVEQVACFVDPIDLLLIPVGGHFTIDSQQAMQTIQQLKPRNVAPMHYKNRYGTLPIAGVDPFIASIGSQYQVNHLNSSVLKLAPAEQGNCYLFDYQVDS